MRSLTPKELLASSEAPTVILLRCADSVRTNRLNERMRIVQKVDVIEHVHLSALSPQQFSALTDSFSMMSLFSLTRLVVVEIPEKKNLLTEKLLASLEHVSQGTTVLLRFRTTLPPKTSLAKLPKESVTVEVETLEGDKLTAWLAREAERLGATNANTGALRLIAQYGNSDLDAAYTALEQIVLFADGEQITEQTVRRVITVIPEAEEFALLDMLDSGSLPRAEALAAGLLTQGSNAFVLLAMIARNQLNRIAVRGGVSSGVSDEKLKRALNMTPWIFDRTKKYVSKRNLPSMKQVINAILRADNRLKGKSLGPEAILSELFTALLPAQVRSGGQNGGQSRDQIKADAVSPYALFISSLSDRL